MTLSTYLNAQRQGVNSVVSNMSYDMPHCGRGLHTTKQWMPGPKIFLVSYDFIISTNTSLNRNLGSAAGR